ncbi:hypothetical protein CSAL01_10377 [Colletotrichum salicis]|uniref:Uncharacterized protein n=1 Tax=Colletotrichum salicis TaxID=1209931 RepID=A0A135U572_9PEZI|nr:hypothetical protein CSAL01_10377 [Colletotrichum salicis]
MTGDQAADFKSFLERLSTISAALLDEKVLKIALTSVRLSVGFQHLIPSLDGLGIRHEHSLLIRVPAAAARRRKSRSKLQKKKQPTLRSSGPTVGPEPTDIGSDFAPSDSGGENGGIVSDSSSDFDIFGKDREKKDRARYFWSSPTVLTSRASPVRLESRGKLESTGEQEPEDSDSSFDIYETRTNTELPKENPASDEDLSDFAS